MLSVIPLLAVAVVLQSGALETASDGVVATAPAAASAAVFAEDDPIGALVTQAQDQEGEDGAPPEPVEPDVAGAAAPSPATAASVPVPSVPSPARPARSSMTYAAPPPETPPAYATPSYSSPPSEPQPYTPSAPVPYASLPPTSSGSVRPIRVQPLVRLPPKPTGSLDGAWTLAQADRGDQLYQFQFNDIGGGNEIEGAWRNVRRSGAMIGSGPVSSVGYDGMGVIIRFLEKGSGEMSVVTLRPAAGGAWSGELRGQDGSAPVVMRRN